MAIPKVFVRSAYNYDVAQASDDSALTCGDPSRAVQSQKEEADINTIVKRFGITGQLPVGVRQPVYGDFEHIGDYQTALAVVSEAQASFAAMPADVRARFQNDPGAFVEFCLDPANAAECRKLGLAEPVEVPPEAPAV